LHNFRFFGSFVNLSVSSLQQKKLSETFLRRLGFDERKKGKRLNLCSSNRVFMVAAVRADEILMNSIGCLGRWRFCWRDRLAAETAFCLCTLHRIRKKNIQGNNVVHEQLTGFIGQ
jgi:hypothetical protein